MPVETELIKKGYLPAGKDCYVEKPVLCNTKVELYTKQEVDELLKDFKFTVALSTLTLLKKTLEVVEKHFNEGILEGGDIIAALKGSVALIIKEHEEQVNDSNTPPRTAEKQKD